ncbi:MAG TPA: rRNA maturation RNase YbeY [Sedimentisphaerales bacterium]|nr:rRNA maturation RNase YbeY [Sedimentisphaerales bacterium]
MGRTKPDHEIVFQITRDFSGIEFSARRLKRVVKMTCERFKLIRATVGIAIVDDREIRRLNRRFLKRNSATDCLSFDLSDGQESPRLRKTGGAKGRRRPVRAFELVLNGERAVREAKQRGHSAEAELALYAVHGLLHNLGFDDSTEEGARLMHVTEDQILQRHGYGSVYDVQRQ